MMYKYKEFTPKALQQPWDGWVAPTATVIGQVELGREVRANSNMRCDSLKSLMIINKLSKFL